MIAIGLYGAVDDSPNISVVQYYPCLLPAQICCTSPLRICY